MSPKLWPLNIILLPGLTVQVYEIVLIPSTEFMAFIRTTVFGPFAVLLLNNLLRVFHMQLTPFHLAVQVRDIDEAREFYGKKMGFPEGRSTEQWIDFNMFGHQFVTHLNPNIGKNGTLNSISNHVDGHGVPVPHFGVVMQFDDWQKFAERAKDFVDEFLIEPYIRFKGEVGEQGTMFFKDPSGNAIEFKGFRNIEQELFAK